MRSASILLLLINTLAKILSLNRILAKVPSLYFLHNSFAHVVVFVCNIIIYLCVNSLQATLTPVTMNCRIAKEAPPRKESFNQPLQEQHCSQEML